MQYFVSILVSQSSRWGCFTLIVFLMSCGCYCSLPLPHIDVGWSAVCDCEISWSYSSFFKKILNKETFKKKLSPILSI